MSDTLADLIEETLTEAILNEKDLDNRKSLEAQRTIFQMLCTRPDTPKRSVLLGVANGLGMFFAGIPDKERGVKVQGAFLLAVIQATVTHRKGLDDLKDEHELHTGV